MALADVVLLPPVPDPPKIICVGINYADHADETGATAAGLPGAVRPLTTTLVRPRRAAPVPTVSQQLDYEGELVAVIGDGGRNIPLDQALEHVVGYSIFNDGSVRRLPAHDHPVHAGEELRRHRGFGPEIVTADELPPGAAGLRLTTTVEGEVLQDSHTGSLIFDVAHLVEAISGVLTLEPGDIIVDRDARRRRRRAQAAALAACRGDGGRRRSKGSARSATPSPPALTASSCRDRVVDGRRRVRCSGARLSALGAARILSRFLGRLAARGAQKACRHAYVLPESQRDRPRLARDRRRRPGARPPLHRGGPAPARQAQADLRAPHRHRRPRDHLNASKVVLTSGKADAKEVVPLQRLPGRPEARDATPTCSPASPPTPSAARSAACSPRARSAARCSRS